MTNDDLGILMICAERYALGRRSYMPSLVCKIIKENINELDEKDINTLIKDIEDPPTMFNDEPWGDDCDKREWMKLLTYLKKSKENKN